MSQALNARASARAGLLAEEPQLPVLMQALQFFQEAPPEQPRQHAHRQEEPRSAGHPGLAVRGQAAARHDAVHMRVMRQRRAPGVQDQRGADARAQVLGIGGDGLQDLGRHIEQQPIDRGLVLQRDVCDRCRQREDHVEILDRQQIGLAGIEPALGRTALALRAVPVATGVVGDLVSAAVGADRKLSHF